MYELTQALNDELDFAAARNFHLLVQNEKKKLAFMLGCGHVHTRVINSRNSKTQRAPKGNELDIDKVLSRTHVQPNSCRLINSV